MIGNDQKPRLVEPFFGLGGVKTLKRSGGQTPPIPGTCLVMFLPEWLDHPAGGAGFFF